MAPTLAQLFNEERRAAVLEWCARVGIPADRVPHEPECLSVASLDDGTLETMFTVWLKDPQRSELRVKHLDESDAPPGFRAPTWDAYSYISDIRQ